MKIISLRCIALLLATCLCSAGASAADVQRPNIVFILADDLGWGDVGCNGQQKIPTPNIDRLATQGLRFTQHYSGAPVCAPSRCVLMTGKHLGHAEIRGNQQASKSFRQFEEGQHPISKSAYTIAMHLRSAGYRTAAMGKWGLGPVASTGDPNEKGFDLFFGYNCQAVAHSYFPSHLWKNKQKIIINRPPVPGHAKQPEGQVKMDDWIGEQYAPHLMIGEAEAFLNNVEDGQPFFLYLPFIEPHVAMHPPKSSVGRFPESWDPVPYRGESGYLPHPRPHAAYAAMVSDLDSYVGRVLEILDSRGLTNNTLVIFTSDNGATHDRGSGARFFVGGTDANFFNSTGGLRGYKGSVYEGGLRVPMIAKFPNRIPMGKTTDFPCYFADWFPTLCDAVELSKPGELDGESFLDVLFTGDARQRNSPMIWVFPEYSGQVAVRSGDFKLVRRGLKTKQPGKWELYNVQQDPQESTDLAAREPQIVTEMVSLLRKSTDENQVFPIAIPE